MCLENVCLCSIKILGRVLYRTGLMHVCLMPTQMQCSHRIGCCVKRLLWLCCMALDGHISTLHAGSYAAPFSMFVLISGSFFFLASVLYIVQVQACGSLVTEEQPHAMLIPLERFLMGYGLYRLDQSASQSPVKPCCVPPELLSPESLGIKLKPIKTRVCVEA